MSARLIKHGRRGASGGKFKILKNEQIRAIHYATLEILWETGINVKSEEGLQILDEGGADIDYKKQIAKIPQHLIEWAIKRTPSRFKYHGRDPKNYWIMEPDRVYFSTAAAGRYVLDLDGKRRPATIKDVQDLIRLTDALDNLDQAGAGAHSPTVPSRELELPIPIRRARNWLRAVEMTEKPVDMSIDYHFDPNPNYRGKEVASDRLKLEALIRGGIEEVRRFPMGRYGVNPVSPLMHDKNQTEEFLVYARNGLPIHFGPEILGNATGPATVAGILVQQNAENLAGVTMTQLAAEPNGFACPIIYGNISSILHPKTTQPMLGGPESGLMNVAAAQIAKHYGFCTRGMANSDSKLPDAQAGSEQTLTTLLAAMGGINVIINAGGGMEPGTQSVSYEKYVIDDDIIGSVRRILNGINVCEETLAVKVINKVGPGGHFLTQWHTKDWFKKEQYLPQVFDKRKYEDWERDGSKDVRERANERAKEILRDHWPEPLDKDIKKKIKEFIHEIEKREAHRV
jgi:trimethylamine--corrinoid protein Co-methyltransferase